MPPYRCHLSLAMLNCKHSSLGKWTSVGTLFGLLLSIDTTQESLLKIADLQVDIVL